VLPAPSIRHVQTNITEKEINDTVRNKFNSSTNNLQRLGINVTAATNIYVMIDLVEESFSMRSVSYQKKAGDYLFPTVPVSTACYVVLG
jgi:hypothetical protein